MIGDLAAVFGNFHYLFGQVFDDGTTADALKPFFLGAILNLF
jgi:hypothetical protein